jgi:hypothetical protein
MDRDACGEGADGVGSGRQLNTRRQGLRVFGSMIEGGEPARAPRQVRRREQAPEGAVAAAAAWRSAMRPRNHRWKWWHPRKAVAVGWFGARAARSKVGIGCRPTKHRPAMQGGVLDRSHFGLPTR